MQKIKKEHWNEGTKVVYENYHSDPILGVIKKEGNELYIEWDDCETTRLNDSVCSELILEDTYLV